MFEPSPSDLDWLQRFSLPLAETPEATWNNARFTFDLPPADEGRFILREPFWPDVAPTAPDSPALDAVLAGADLPFVDGDAPAATPPTPLYAVPDMPEAPSFPTSLNEVVGLTPEAPAPSWAPQLARGFGDNPLVLDPDAGETFASFRQTGAFRFEAFGDGVIAISPGPMIPPAPPELVLVAADAPSPWTDLPMAWSGLEMAQVDLGLDHALGAMALLP